MRLLETCPILSVDFPNHLDSALRCVACPDVESRTPVERGLHDATQGASPQLVDHRSPGSGGGHLWTARTHPSRRDPGGAHTRAWTLGPDRRHSGLLWHVWCR